MRGKAGIFRLNEPCDYYGPFLCLSLSTFMHGRAAKTDSRNRLDLFGRPFWKWQARILSANCTSGWTDVEGSSNFPTIINGQEPYSENFGGDSYNGPPSKTDAHCGRRGFQSTFLKISVRHLPLFPHVAETQLTQIHELITGRQQSRSEEHAIQSGSASPALFARCRTS